MREFLNQFPAQEWTRFVDQSGKIGAHGIAAIKLALFSRVFSGEYGERVLRAFTEIPGEGKQNIEKALFLALPRLVALVGRIESKDLDPAFDIWPDIIAAVEYFGRLKREGKTPGDFAAHEALPGLELEPATRQIISAMEGNLRAPSRLAALFNTYANLAMEQPPPSQASLFENVVRPDKTQLWHRTVETVQGKDDTTQELAFAQEAQDLQTLYQAISKEDGPLRDFTPNPELTPEEKAVERQFAELLANDPSGMAQAYSEIEDSRGGKVINPDLVKELSPAYHDHAKWVNAVHEPSSAFSKWLFRRALAQNPDGPVLILAGGAGSGKSTILNVSESLETKFPIILDVTLSSKKSAEKFIRDTHAAGREVEIAYIHRPIEHAVAGAVKRASKDPVRGRVVSIEVLSNTHFGAQNTFQNLLEEKPQGVHFSLVTNQSLV